MERLLSPQSSAGPSLKLVSIDDYNYPVIDLCLILTIRMELKEFLHSTTLSAVVLPIAFTHTCVWSCN